MADELKLSPEFAGRVQRAQSPVNPNGNRILTIAAPFQVVEEISAPYQPKSAREFPVLGRVLENPGLPTVLLRSKGARGEDIYAIAGGVVERINHAEALERLGNRLDKSGNVVLLAASVPNAPSVNVKVTGHNMARCPEKLSGLNELPREDLPAPTKPLSSVAVDLGVQKDVNGNGWKVGGNARAKTLVPSNNPTARPVTQFVVGAEAEAREPWGRGIVKVSATAVVTGQLGEGPVSWAPLSDRQLATEVRMQYRLPKEIGGYKYSPYVGWRLAEPGPNSNELFLVGLVIEGSR